MPTIPLPAEPVFPTAVRTPDRANRAVPGGGSSAILRPLRAPRRAALLAAALLVVSGVPAVAAGGDGAPALVAGRNALRVATAGGTAFQAPLPNGVVVSALAPLSGGDWIAAGVRGGTTLLLFRGTAQGAERVAAPSAGGRFAAWPDPLAADGRLLGLTWLAGSSPRRLSVRFALWEGDGWGPVETVAGPAPGSQLALRGTVLSDGSALLVWSAFDGQDDEIYWSRRQGGRWSEPARVADDNRVPDITPAVVPLGDGALVAWSRYQEGEYRLVTARLGSGGWSHPEPAGPPGSLYPALTAHGDGALLLYRDARAGDWTVLRLDAGARPAARAVITGTPNGERPVVLGAGPQGARVVPGPKARPETVAWQLLP